jgi:ATP-binding cassette subfamily C protein/ATP-binding cassette subfamily C exporter for protease/lipase/ATP-binding cassette subfamily C protein EexD
MPEKSSDARRASSDPTELERAVGACRSAFTVCAVFSLAINLLMLVSPIYMLQVYDRVLTTGRVETLLMLTLIATIALVVMCALDALRTSITIRVGCWLNEQLGPAYLACAVRGRLQGDLSGAEPLRDISQIQTFIATQGLTAFFDAPWVPIFVALIWILHPMLGLVAISSAVVLFVLSAVNELATRKANQTANRKQTEAMLLADATIRNAEIVQAMHILPAMVNRWAAVNGTVIDGLRRSGDVGGLVLATTKFVRFFVQVAILGVGAWLVVNSQLTAGAMIAGSILLGRALAPVELAISVWRNFNATRFSYDRLKKTIGDYPAPLQRTRLPAPQGKVVVDAVSYLTPNTAQLILSQVSCAVEPGEALAVIGPSGAGKSTLCRLMVGLAIPNVGEIRLDGSPIHHWDPAQFGQHLGFLPQDVELFAGSVRDNIARMQSVDDEAVVRAATLACAHEMIQHLPQGYDTRVGDGGVRLSGGQRQRVGLARAVFGSPRFIVLDEPNANLDQAGEAALTEAIFELKQVGVALVIVGHRPSTLSAVDKILFLKEGRVAMFGQRDQVLNALKEASMGSLPETRNGEARQRINALEARQRISALKERLAGSLPQTNSRDARQLISAGNGSDRNGKAPVGVS